MSYLKLNQDHLENSPTKALVGLDRDNLTLVVLHGSLKDDKEATCGLSHVTYLTLEELQDLGIMDNTSDALALTMYVQMVRAFQSGEVTPYSTYAGTKEWRCHVAAALRTLKFDATTTSPELSLLDLKIRIAEFHTSVITLMNLTGLTPKDLKTFIINHGLRE